MIHPLEFLFPRDDTDDCHNEIKLCEFSPLFIRVTAIRRSFASRKATVNERRTKPCHIFGTIVILGLTKIWITTHVRLQQVKFIVRESPFSSCPGLSLNCLPVWRHRTVSAIFTINGVQVSGKTKIAEGNNFRGYESWGIYHIYKVFALIKIFLFILILMGHHFSQNSWIKSIHFLQGA